MPAMGPYVSRSERVKSINDYVKSLEETAKRAGNDPVMKGEAYERIAKVLSEYADKFPSKRKLSTSKGDVDLQKMRETSTAYAAKAAYEFNKAGLIQRARDNLTRLNIGVIAEALNQYTKLDDIAREVKRP